MFSFILKIISSAVIISFISWLSIKKPQLSGFLISVPIISIITIAFSFLEHQNKEQTIVFAKSIFVGVPISLLFFVPFFFHKYLMLSFWSLYLIGIIFLVIGYFGHKFFTQEF